MDALHFEFGAYRQTLTVPSVPGAGDGPLI